MHNRIIGVIGPSGCGKTFTVTNHLKTQPRWAAFVIFPNDTGYLAAADEEIFCDPKKWVESMRGEKFRIIYHPLAGAPTVDKDGGIVIPFVNEFVEGCYERQNMLMVLDEAHLICSSRTCPPMLFLYTVGGRRQGLDAIYVSHSFATIHPQLRRNSHEFWFWKIIEPNDLQGIRDRCGTETMERVRDLRGFTGGRQGEPFIPGEMLKWSTYGGIETNDERDGSRGEVGEAAGEGSNPGKESIET